jgi:enamine deaminase RidA (YjgF/YER057c/UK114 family)
MSNISRYASGGKWEDVIGYSRTVKSGPLVSVSGCTSMKDGRLVYQGSTTLQTKQVFENLAEALKLAGAGFEHVIRTRIYIVNELDWKEVAAIHSEVFGNFKPACTIVVVTSLLDPAMLVEIEADAWLD